ncbi:hypothetical protein OG897_18770 [Streptomyces sp. NBC_00237]|nr:hypothetical protein [Streptomyces sp. NBC_00237]MCX5203483.1 hypothetical protein [Streptomyces sp. NBC_00237]
MENDRTPEDDTRAKPELKKVAVRDEARKRDRLTIEKRPAS